MRRGKLRKVAFGTGAGSMETQGSDESSTGGAWLLGGAAKVDVATGALGSGVARATRDASSTGAATISILVHAFRAGTLALGSVGHDRRGY